MPGCTIWTRGRDRLVVGSVECDGWYQCRVDRGRGGLLTLVGDGDVV